MKYKHEYLQINNLDTKIPNNYLNDNTLTRMMHLIFLFINFNFFFLFFLSLAMGWRPLSCVVRRPLTSSSQELMGILTEFCMYSTRHTFWYSLMLIPSIPMLPYACWSLSLLSLLILMLIILMLILIESRSLLIVYWLGDRKLINAYLSKNSIQNINLPKEFLKI